MKLKLRKCVRHLLSAISCANSEIALSGVALSATKKAMCKICRLIMRFGADTHTCEWKARAENYSIDAKRFPQSSTFEVLFSRSLIFSQRCMRLKLYSHTHTELVNDITRVVQMCDGKQHPIKVDAIKCESEKQVRGANHPRVQREPAGSKNRFIAALIYALA